MDCVIEIQISVLPIPKRYVSEVGIDVSHVVKQNTADVRAQKRKAQLKIVEEQPISSDRETGGSSRSRSRCRHAADIARACLVISKAAHRNAASAEESLGQGNSVEPSQAGRNLKRDDQPQLGLSGEHKISSDWGVCAIPRQEAVEIPLRSEKVARQSCVYRIPESTMSVGRIIPMILYVTGRQETDSHRLQEGGNQQRRNLNISRADTSIRKPHQKS